jgi:hypothetical protein
MHPDVSGRGAPGAVAPTGVKFNFWSSIADLIRLVVRSKAKGLKTRLLVALTLVLIGKWTGVIAPLAVQNAIDGLSHHLAFLVVVGFAAAYVGLQFIANTAPYMRDAICRSRSTFTRPNRPAASRGSSIAAPARPTSCCAAWCSISAQP